MRGSAGVRVLIATALAALAVPAVAWGHAERPAYFPNSEEGAVPTYDGTDPDRVVCKPNSEQRIYDTVKDQGKRDAALALLDDCSYEHIQGTESQYHDRSGEVQRHEFEGRGHPGHGHRPRGW
jgi:hypothetical protein